MTHSEFLNEIRSAYLNARKCAYTPKRSPEILSRGTSHSISSISEDLFACYCAEKVIDPSKIKIIIDPQISFPKSGLLNRNAKKSLLIRPDIALAKGDLFTCFFDIKTDLGYKRNEFYNHAIERNDQLNSIKLQIAKMNDGETKSSELYLVSPNIKFIYILISQKNISTATQNKAIKEARELENIDVFLLSKGDHLNSYFTSPNWVVNTEDFDKLDKLLDTYLNSP